MANPLSDLLNFQWPSMAPDAPPSAGLAYTGPGSPWHAINATSDALENRVASKEFRKQRKVTRVSDGKSKIVSAEDAAKLEGNPEYRVETPNLIAMRAPPVSGVMPQLLGAKGSVKFVDPDQVELAKKQGYTTLTADEYRLHREYQKSSKRVEEKGSAQRILDQAVDSALLTAPSHGETRNLYLGGEDLAARAEKAWYGSREHPELDDTTYDPATDKRFRGRGSGVPGAGGLKPPTAEYVGASIRADQDAYQESLEAALDQQAFQEGHPVEAFLGGALGAAPTLTPAGAIGSLAFRGGSRAAAGLLSKTAQKAIRETVQRRAFDEAVKVIAGAGSAGALGSLAEGTVRLASQEHLGLDAFWDELKNAGFSALFSAGLGGALHGAISAPKLRYDLKNQALRTKDIEAKIKAGKYDFKAVQSDPEVQRVMARIKTAQSNVATWDQAIKDHQAQPAPKVPDPDLPMPTDLEAAPWKYKIHDEAELQQKLELDARREQAIANLMPRPEREIFKSPYRWQGQQPAIARAMERHGKLGDEAHMPPEIAQAQQQLRDLKAAAPPEVKQALKTWAKYNRSLESKAEELGFSGKADEPDGPEGGVLAKKPRVRPMPASVQKAQQTLGSWADYGAWRTAQRQIRRWKLAREGIDRQLDSAQEYNNAGIKREQMADPAQQQKLLQMERDALTPSGDTQGGRRTLGDEAAQAAQAGARDPWVGKTMFSDPIPPGANLDELEAVARAKLSGIEQRLFTKGGQPKKNAFRNLQHQDRWDYEGAKQRLRQIDEIRRAQERELKTTPINTMIDLALENVGAGKAKSVPEIVEYARKARVHLLGDGTPAGKVAATKLEAMINEVDSLERASKAVPRSLLRQELIDEANRLAAEREWTTRRLMSEQGLLQEQADLLHQGQLDALRQAKLGDESMLDYAKRDLRSASDTAAREHLWADTEGKDYVAVQKEIDRLRAENAKLSQAPDGSPLMAAANAFFDQDFRSWGALGHTLSGMAAGTSAAALGMSMAGSLGAVAAGSFASLILRNFLYGKGRAAYRAYAAAKAAGQNAPGFRSRLVNEIKSRLKGKTLPTLPKASLVEIVSKAQFDHDRSDTYKPPKNSGPGYRLAQLVRQRSEEIAAAAADPDGLTGRLRQALAPARMHDPEIVDRAKELWQKTIDFLHSKMPKDPEPFAPFGRNMWLPSDDEATTAARYIAAAFDPPGQLLDELATGRVSPETIETMQVLRPELYNWMRDQALSALMETGGKGLSYERRVALSDVFGVRMDPNEDPAYVNEMNLFVASVVAGEAEQQKTSSRGGYTVPQRQVNLGSYSNATIAGKFGG